MELIQNDLLDIIKENIVWMTNEPRSMFIHLKLRQGVALEFNNNELNKYFSRCELSVVLEGEQQQLKGYLKDRDIFNYLTLTSIVKLSYA
jgi:hypothetical protein